MRRTLVVALTVGVATLAAAAPPTRGEIVKASKPAVALLEQTHGGRRQNSAAVAVTADGYFLTTPSGLPVMNVPEGKYTLIVSPGDEGQKELRAVVVRRDDDLGLVLLKAETKDPLKPLALADADPAEKDELILLTCPNARGPGQAEYSTVGVALGTAGRVPTPDQLQRFDAKVTVPGLPGGAAVNADGKLAGLLTYRLFTDDGPRVIPASRVRRFLDRPRFAVTAPEVGVKERFASKAYTTTLTFDPPRADPPTVELVIRTSAGERRFPMKSAGKGYGATAAAFEENAKPLPLGVEVTYPDGQVRGTVDDRTVKTAAGERRLSEVSRITFGKDGAVVFTDGTRSAGAVTDLGELKATVGGRQFSLPTDTARELAVRPPPGSADAYLIAVVASAGGREIGREESVHQLVGSTPPPLAALLKGQFAPPREALARRTYVSLAPKVGEPDEIGRPLDFPAKHFQLTLVPVGGTGDIVRLECALTRGQSTGVISNTQGIMVQFRSPKWKRFAAGDFPQSDPDPRKWDGGLVTAIGELRKPSTSTAHLGHFVVHEYEVANDKVTAFAADFTWQPDATRKDVLVGVIRFNSKYE